MAYDIAVLIGLSGIAFIFAYLAMNMDREKIMTAGLQILFISLAFYTILIILNVLAIMATDAGETAIANMLYGLYTPILYAVIFIVALIIVMTAMEAAGMSLEFAKEAEKE